MKSESSSAFCSSFTLVWSGVGGGGGGGVGLGWGADDKLLTG